MNIRAPLLAALTAFLAVEAAHARFTVDKPVIRPLGSGNQKRVQKVADEFKVPKEEVARLRRQGLGWSEVRRELSKRRPGRRIRGK